MLRSRIPLIFADKLGTISNINGYRVMIVALVNIGSETEQIEYKKNIGELKEAMFSIAAILNRRFLTSDS